ncbi:DUF2391 family protein [Candidatus Woesearchaeota archaeon]|nr:DUF2391 family protein [Candidatus Woesearchaeota archaeon]
MKKKKGSSVSKKLDKILKGQDRLYKEELKLETEEAEAKKGEEQVKELEKKQLTEIEALERIEKEVEKEVKQHPLTKVTINDLWRGSLGAFVGTTLHYTVYYGVEIAENLTVSRATIIYILSFIVGAVFLYITGFMKIKDKAALKYLPIRVTLLYAVSILVSVGVLYLFFPAFGASFEDAYKQTATVSLIAVIGACTADLLRRE